QIAAARADGRMPVSGAHTVGAPDGGTGLPGTGWSRTHGDLRIPHFIGLHAVQVLPFVAFVLGRWRRPAHGRVGLVGVAAGSYAALFGLLMWQALRGQSLVQPDALMLQALGAWLLLTAATAWVILRREATPVARPTPA